jgi:hypothetical protein
VTGLWCWRVVRDPARPRYWIDGRPYGLDGPMDDGGDTNVTELEKPDNPGQVTLLGPGVAMMDAPAGIVLERPDQDWIRDGYGRPIILPDPSWLEGGDGQAPPSWIAPDGSVWPDRRYTRVTTFGEALLDGSALARWKMRRVALGMGRRPDYVTAAAALTAEDRDRQALNDLAEKALEAAGPNAADIGTALHGFTERMDRGEDIGVVPPQYRADLDAYRQVIAPLTFLHREERMVCDQLETAGTPDAIVLCSEPDPDGNVTPARIADLKTGNVEYTAGKFSTQLAIYAHSRLYDPATGERRDPEHHLDRRWGLVVHMPAGMGTAQLRWLRLDHGWQGAVELAGQVRAWRKVGARELSRPVFLPPGVQWSEDGKCQGTKRDGERCTYRAQDNGFCSRHQSQSLGDAPVVQGDPAAIPDPVLEAEALDNRAEDAVRAQAEQAASTAVDPAVDPVLEAVRAERAELERIRDWTPPQPDQGAPPELGGAAYPEPVEQPATAPMVQLDRPDPDPADVPGGAAFGPMDLDPDDPEQQAWLAAQPCDTCGLVGNHDEECSAVIVEDPPAELEQPSGPPEAPEPRELRVPAMPYRAQDPMDPAQLQGNPRPHSSMGTPEDAMVAAAAAERSLLLQVASCMSRSELQLLWEATQRQWTPAVVEASRQRAVEVDRLPGLERTSAALWQAIRSADSEGHLLQLWQDQSLNPLWTDAHRAAAAARQAELRRA